MLQALRLFPKPGARLMGRTSRIGEMVNYSQRLVMALEAFDFFSLEALFKSLENVRDSGSTVFVIGNGGSASTASHFANDWMLGTEVFQPSLRVICLADNVPALTATGNDQNFSRVFTRQIEHLGDSKDLLIAISASGNSPNILDAISFAKSIGMKSVGLTGFDGGRLSKVADLSVHVPTELGDYGVVEDVHLAIGHAIKEMIIERWRV